MLLNQTFIAFESKQKVPVADGFEVSCNINAQMVEKQIVNPISYGCPTVFKRKIKDKIL